jgi:triosephosphate isomerase
MRPLIAGNWKMNGTGESLVEVTAVARWAGENARDADVLLCPPFTLIARASCAAAGRIAIGGQDCSTHSSGAFTGEISAEMLKEAGACAVIVGHSERRRYHGETDFLVSAKANAAQCAGLLALICVGETEEEREDGRTEDVVRAQIAGSIPVGIKESTAAVAYEPVWAIGTGRTPTDDEIAGTHALIRGCLTERFGDSGSRMRLLYGGSVKPANAAGVLALPNVNGVLVGGASLKADEFLAVIRSVPAL